jgi:hypothetical protein
MKRIEKTVFISYRRANEAWALAIYAWQARLNASASANILEIARSNSIQI